MEGCQQFSPDVTLLVALPYAAWLPRKKTTVIRFTSGQECYELPFSGSRTAAINHQEVWASYQPNQLILVGKLAMSRPKVKNASPWKANCWFQWLMKKDNILPGWTLEVEAGVLLTEFAGVSSASPDDLGRTNIIQHTPTLGTANPSISAVGGYLSSSKQWRRQKLRQCWTVIKPSLSPKESPKKNEYIPFCVDYQQLNSKVTTPFQG